MLYSYIYYYLLQQQARVMRGRRRPLKHPPVAKFKYIANSLFFLKRLKETSHATSSKKYQSARFRSYYFTGSVQSKTKMKEVNQNENYSCKKQARKYHITKRTSKNIISLWAQNRNNSKAQQTKNNYVVFIREQTT